MKKSRRILLYVGIGVFSLAMIVLVIFGVTTHEESELLGVCFNEQGRVTRYEEWGPDTCPELPRWEQRFPLRVSWKTDNPHLPDNPGDVVPAAIRNINTRLGFQAFRYAEAGSCELDTDICMSLGEPFAVGGLDGSGSVEHSLRGTRLHCNLYTTNTGTSEMLLHVIEHELGHCLGLAHDDFESSIMFPVSSETPMFTFPPRITDRDRRVLRGLYVD